MLNEEEMANQAREIEQVYTALELQERTLEAAISEGRKEVPETVSAIAVETVNESDVPPTTFCSWRWIILSSLLLIVVVVGTVLGILNGPQDDDSATDSSLSTSQTSSPTLSRLSRPN